MAKKSKREQSTIDRDDALEFQGTIEEALPGTLFKVSAVMPNQATNAIVLCTLGGRLRMNHIRLLVGDRVVIAVSPYDLSRGRVIWRG